MTLLDAGYLIAAAVTAPIWARKARGDWRGRMGHQPPNFSLGAYPQGSTGAANHPFLQPDAREVEARAAGGRPPRILLHAVSVGEVNAIRALVPKLTCEAEVVVSVGTDTGIGRAHELFRNAPRVAVVRYPLDFSWSVRRFLDWARPDVVGLVELELWPQFIRSCNDRGIPVAVINGRLSPRSFKGYRQFRRFVGPMFRSLAAAGVQDEAYRGRFVEMGVPAERCRVTGSMKWDSVAVPAPGEPVPGAAGLAAMLGIESSRPLVVAGSTGPGEEELLHLECPPGVQLLCAPRKPERFDEAAAAMRGCARRSEVGGGRKLGGEAGREGAGGADRFLLDSIGELRAAYSLADVAVVGRSFFDLYGSDPVEPAALGKAGVIGPAVADFEGAVAALEGAGGLVRTDRAGLGRTIRELLGDPERRAALGQAARACVRANQGATARHADLLIGLLPRVGGGLGEPGSRGGRDDREGNFDT
ncbi:MAG: 3-deoxy-D-manno-octulosonic acid transferase [Phycisphaerales bacterium]|nr:3-deoxy-D-manno-octulosonic acid transferase [Phycisphaerales bacterium]